MNMRYKGCKVTRREIVSGLVALPASFARPALSDTMIQTVVDLTGRTVSIPRRPQRIVSLADSVFTVPLYELGISVVASTRFGSKVHAFEALFGLSSSEAGIADLGQSDSFDIEQIAALRPDLILADISFSRIDGLSQIAPVYTANWFFGEQNTLGLPQETAKAFGVEARYLELQDNYQSRIAAMRELIGSDERELIWLAAMVSSFDFLLGRSGGAFAIVARDLGLVQPQWVREITAPDAFFPISLEQIPQLDADLFMLMRSWNEGDLSADAVRRSMTSQMPGWERFVPAARNDSIVYISGETAIVPAFAAADRVMDAIETQWKLMK